MSVTSSGAAPPGGGQSARYFSLRWNSHPVELVTGFTGLYQSETLVDVTLAAEGKHLQAHKMLLSACSDYFQSLFSINPCQHPIVILKDVNFDDLQTIVQFMYNGTVNISGEKLPDIMKVSQRPEVSSLNLKQKFRSVHVASVFFKFQSSGRRCLPESNRRLLFEEENSERIFFLLFLQRLILKHFSNSRLLLEAAAAESERERERESVCLRVRERN